MFGNIFSKLVLSIIADNMKQLLFTVSIDYVSCRKSLPLIHPHIQRYVFAVCESPVLLIQLKRGNAKIQKNSVHTGYPQILQHFRHIHIVISYNRNFILKRSKPLGACPDRILVLVNANISSLFRESVQDMKGMSASSKSPIHVDTVRFYL